MERTSFNDSLYIPVNIKTRFEFFDGYGIKELLCTAITTAISGTIAIALNTVTGNTALCVLIVLITVATSVMALSKDQSNQSIVDQIRFMYRFLRTQRKFKYKFLDEWGDEY